MSQFDAKCVRYIQLDCPACCSLLYANAGQAKFSTGQDGDDSVAVITLTDEYCGHTFYAVFRTHEGVMSLELQVPDSVTAAVNARPSVEPA